MRSDSPSHKENTLEFEQTTMRREVTCWWYIEEMENDYWFFENANSSTSDNYEINYI